MTTAVLSIGSNIGDSIGHLQSVVDAAGPAVRLVSSVYRTAPWGNVPQDAFHNAILIADDPGRDPAGWLAFARECEKHAARVREVRWGPRTLDVDIVAVFDDGVAVISGDPELTLPHPRADERAFVLAPWVEVQPEATLPRGPVGVLLRSLDPNDPQQQVERRDDVHLRMPSDA